MGLLDFLKLNNKTTAIVNQQVDSAWDMQFPTDQSAKEYLQEDLRFGIGAVFQGLAFIMPNPDPVLKKLGFGKDVEAYTELLADPQLYGAIENNRKPGITSLELDISNEKANKAEVDFINKYFNELINSGDYWSIMNQSLDTSLFGRMTFGLQWGIVDGYFVPVNISSIPHQYCKFDNLNNFMVSQTGGIFQSPDHPARYINLRHKPTVTNPYGEALLSRCFWNVLMKKEGMKLWASFMEKFGMPWVKGSYNTATLKASLKTEDTQKAIDYFFDTLKKMARDGVLVHPEGTDAELIGGTAVDKNVSVYENLVRICDEQNAKLQLGHSGSTESTPGKLGNENTAIDVRKHIIDSDKKYPVAFFNKLIYWIHQFNFSGPVIPEYKLFAEEEVDMNLAQRDNTLVPVLQLAGLKHSKSYFINKYGFKEEDLEPWNPLTLPANNQQTKALSALQTKNQLSRFVNSTEGFFDAKNQLTPDQTIIDDAADTSAADTQATDALLALVTNYIESKGDFKSALTGLAKLFPKMNSKELQDKFEQVLFMADVVGRLSVKDELGIE